MELEGHNLEFLNDVELNTKSSTSLRINEEELYMLKYIKFRGYKFGTYIKRLINDDIIRYCQNKEQSVINEKHIKEIVLSVLRDINIESSPILIDKVEEEDEGILALKELGLDKR